MTSIGSVLMIGQAVVGAYLISKAVVEIWNSSAEVDLKSPAIEIEQVEEALEEEDYDAGDFDETEEDWMDLANFIFDEWTPIWAGNPYNQPSKSELIKLDLTSDIEDILEEFPIFVIAEEDEV